MKTVGTEALPLFHQPEPLPKAAVAAIARSIEGRSDRIEALVPLMRRLARDKGEYGVTIGDLRLHAVQQGLLSGESHGRALAWLGQVPKRAGLVPTNEMRRSIIDKSHGNPHRVWRLPSNPQPPTP